MCGPGVAVRYRGDQRAAAHTGSHRMTGLADGVVCSRGGLTYRGAPLAEPGAHASPVVPRDDRTRAAPLTSANLDAVGRGESLVRGTEIPRRRRILRVPVIAVSFRIERLPLHRGDRVCGLIVVVRG